MLRELPDVIARPLFCGAHSKGSLCGSSLYTENPEDWKKANVIDIVKRARKSCRELQAGQSHLDPQEGEWNNLSWKLFLNTLKTNDLE